MNFRYTDDKQLESLLNASLSRPIQRNESQRTLKQKSKRERKARHIGHAKRLGKRELCFTLDVKSLSDWLSIIRTDKAMNIIKEKASSFLLLLVLAAITVSDAQAVDCVYEDGLKTVSNFGIFLIVFGIFLIIFGIVMIVLECKASKRDTKPSYYNDEKPQKPSPSIDRKNERFERDSETESRESDKLNDNFEPPKFKEDEGFENKDYYHNVWL